MHELLPALPAYLSGVLESFTYFKPEITLAILFIVVIITDLLFGKNSEKLCRIVAFGGVLLIALQDFNQYPLVVISGEAIGHFFFYKMMLLAPATIKFKITIDVLAFIMILWFEWDDKLSSHSKGLSDLYSIVIGSVFGLHLMAMAANLLSIYLAIELVSIASYMMVAYHTENIYSSEAGLKYVLFGAASSAIMLFGMSLLYAFTGTLTIYSGGFLGGLQSADHATVSFTLVLTLVGLGFKLSFVPMHFWVPDVYEGAPTPVTAWLSTLPKIAGFALLVNFLGPFILAEKWSGFDFRLFFSVIGIITMIAGNFAAVLQTNVKRMLAYSSIGHTGFALMAVVTFDTKWNSALVYYLAVYAIANICALALASYFSNATSAEDTESYQGLGHKFQAASVCFVIVLISLTGLPVTAGFTGKLFVFSAVYGIYSQNHNIWLLLLMITGAVTTVVSLFYYIKIPLNLFLKRSENVINRRNNSNNIIYLAIILSFFIFLLGMFPSLIY